MVQRLSDGGLDRLLEHAGGLGVHAVLGDAGLGAGVALAAEGDLVARNGGPQDGQPHRHRELVQARAGRGRLDLALYFHEAHDQVESTHLLVLQRRHDLIASAAYAQGTRPARPAGQLGLQRRAGVVTQVGIDRHVGLNLVKLEVVRRRRSPGWPDAGDAEPQDGDRRQPGPQESVSGHVSNHRADCILPRVSVRTSSVVATGMIALAAIGLVTIFGGSIAAVLYPPTAAPETAGPSATAPATSPPAPTPGAPAPATSPPTTTATPHTTT